MDIYLDTNNPTYKIQEEDLGRLFRIQSVREKNNKYKYVSKKIFQGKDIIYEARIPKFKWGKYFMIERDAAIAVDKFLLEHGKNPLNILIPKI